MCEMKSCESPRQDNRNHPRERIRVLRVVARMNTGGPALQIHALHQHLPIEQFNQLLVFGPTPDNEQELFYEDRIASFVRLPQLQQGTPLVAVPRSIIQVRKIIKFFRPDIVHTHTFLAGLIGRTAALTMRRRPALVHTFHGHLLHGYFGRGKTGIIKLLESVLALPSQRLLAVGERVQMDLVDAGIGKNKQFEVVPPGLEEISTNDASYPYEHAGHLTFGYFGRLEQIKRPDRFLDVVAVLVEEYPESRFLVGGGGTLEGWMRDEVGRRGLPVEFLGWIQRPEDFFQQIDVLVLTSDNEGMPTSIIQAAMCDRPAVAPRVGSVDEVIVHGQTGFVVDADVLQLASSLSQFAREPHLVGEMGGKAQLHSSNCFSADRLAADHQRIYLDILNEKRGH